MTVPIELRNVTMEYQSSRGTTLSLSDASVRIEAGEFVTVVGPSGCGKSTMLNLMAGLLTPTAGEVLVGGEPVTGPGPERGVIFQQYALFPWLSVVKNVEFGLRLQHVSRTERRERAMHFIDLVGLSRFADALPRELSGGMKQRCAIARAYAVNPAILLMDEPFGALDAMTRVTMQDDLLATWQRDQRTAVFITHDVEEAAYLASRVIVMSAHPGRIDRIVDIPLPYPRTEATRLSDEFAELRRLIWTCVHSGHSIAATSPST